MGALEDYFSIVALFILFRETIEASIIVAVLLQFLHRSFPHLKRQVWWGVFCGLVVAIGFGVGFSVVFYVFKNNLFSGKNEAIFKGSIAWFAATLICILAFLMLQYRGWEAKLQRKLEAMANKELNKTSESDEKPVPDSYWGKMRYYTCLGCAAFWGPVGRFLIVVGTAIDDFVAKVFNSIGRCCRRSCQILPCKRLRPEMPPEQMEMAEDELTIRERAATRGHGVGIFLIVLTTVTREGIESVIFLAGVGNNKPKSLILPGIVGFICGISVGIFLYMTGKQVKDIRYFVIIMAVFLLFIAGGQVMQGVNYLTIGGMFGYASVWLNLRPWYMQPAWDISSCCAITDANSQQFWVIAQAIVGYQDKPSYLQIIFYFSYWVMVIAVGLFRYFTGRLFDADFKHTRQLKAEAEAAAKAEQEAQAQAATDDIIVLAKKYPPEPSKDLDSHSSASPDGRESPSASATHIDVHTERPAAVAEPQDVEMQPPPVQTARP